MTTKQRKPLWEAMDDAFHAVTQGVPVNLETRIGTAAQLRAIVKLALREVGDLGPIQDFYDWLEAEAEVADVAARGDGTK